MAPKNVTFESKPLRGAKWRLAALWSVTFPTGVNKSFIQWYEKTEISLNLPHPQPSPHLSQRCLWSLNPRDLHLYVEEMSEVNTQFLLRDSLHSLWSPHKIDHANVTYIHGYLNERCYHLWRNKCRYKWTLTLWYMISLQAGEIYQVSSIKIIIIIHSTLFNSSQSFNSVFSQLILITLL